VELAERNIKRCDGIIEEFMDFTKVKEPVTEPTTIDEWLAGILLSREIPEGIELTTDFRSDAELLIDRKILAGAVIAVITNSIHALEDEESQGNSLTVTTRVSENRLEICVADTGVGIPEDEMEKIFEPLFSTKGFGVGLGLPVAKKAMDMHNGEIEVVGRLGVGTKVTLWLPLSKTDSEGGTEQPDGGE
jgi:signal transduction histidine kinase